VNAIAKKNLNAMFSGNAKSNLGAVFLAILWNFSDFLGKWWFFLCESALENKIFAMRNWTVPFRIRKAFGYLR
jgi:hypothetical protein